MGYPTLNTAQSAVQAVPTRENAREKAGSALDKARDIVDAMTGETAETDATKIRALIDIAGEWRYLIDELA